MKRLLAFFLTTILSVSAQEDWTDSTPLPFTPVNDLAFGNGVWVAATGSGLFTSTDPDGDDWTLEESSGGAMNTVGFGNGTFVAVATDGDTYTSTDGEDWDRDGSSPGTFAPQTIIYANNTWVAAGATRIFTSTNDGQQWNQAYSSGSFQPLDIAYGNGVWVCVGSGSQNIRRSTNLTNWTFDKAGTGTLDLTGIAFGNGIFMASSAGGSVFKSSDADTWTQVKSSNNQILNDIVFGNGLFVAVGGGDSYIVATGNDGGNGNNNNWEVESNFSNQLNAVAYSGTHFVAGGPGGRIESSPSPFSVSPTSFTNVQAGAASAVIIEVDTVSFLEYEYTANDPWLSFSNASPQTGSRDIFVELETNTGNSSRTGSVTIHGVTIPITQNGQGGGGGPGNPPATPGNFTATPATARSIDLSWTDVANNSGYRLERKLSSATNFTLITNLGANATSFTDTNLPYFTRQDYRLTATSSAGNSGSATASAATLATPLTGLVATSVTDSSVSLTWDHYQVASHYNIRRNGVSLQTSPVTTNSYVDNGPSGGGETFTYEVAAVLSSGDQSEPDSVTVTTPIRAPFFTLVEPRSTSSIFINWNSVSNATNYVLQASSNGSSWSTIYSGLISQYLQNSLSSTSSRHYRVRSERGTLVSPWREAPANPYLTFPAVPSLSFETIEATRFTLNWTNVSGETGYQIESFLDNPNFPSETWILRHSPGVDVTSVVSTGLFPGQKYLYRIRAKNPDGTFSAYSDIIEQVAPPLGPDEFTASYTTINGTPLVGLNWDPNALGTLVRFDIQRRFSGSPFWTFVGTSATHGPSDRSYTDAAVQHGRTYNYRIRQVTQGNTPSEWVNSDPILVDTAPAVPTNVRAVALDDDRIELKWNSATGATGYDVLIRIERFGFPIYTTIGTSSGTIYIVDGLNPETEYTYYVRARRRAEFGQRSGPVSATTNFPLVIDNIQPKSARFSWPNTLGGNKYSPGFRLAGETTFDGDGSVSTGVFTKTVDPLVPGRIYEGRLVVNRPFGPTLISGIYTFRTPPSAPQSLSVIADPPDRIRLTWSHPGQRFSTVIERQTKGNTSWAKILTSQPTQTTYIDTGVGLGKEYRYRLSTIANSISSSTVTSDFVAPGLPIPSPPSVNSPTLNSLKISAPFGANPNFDLQLEQREEGASEWKAIHTFTAPAANKVVGDSGLNPGTRYHYRLRSLFGNSSSAPSTTNSHVTLSHYQSWRRKEFGTLSEQGNRGPHDDFDRDGVNNLFEFLFMTSPTDDSSWQGPKVRIAEQFGNEYLVMEFPARIELGDVSFAIRGSNNLGSPLGWNPIYRSSGLVGMSSIDYFTEQQGGIFSLWANTKDRETYFLQLSVKEE